MEQADHAEATHETSPLPQYLRWDTNDGTGAFLTLTQVQALIFEGFLERLVGRVGVVGVVASSKEVVQEGAIATRTAEAMVLHYQAAVAGLRQGTSDSVAKSLVETAFALEAMQDTLVESGASQKQAEDVAKAISMLRDPGCVSFHSGKVLIVNGKNIYFCLERAAGNFEEQEWKAFGSDLAVAVEALLTPLDTSSTLPSSSALWWHGPLGACWQGPAKPGEAEECRRE